MTDIHDMSDQAILDHLEARAKARLKKPPHPDAKAVLLFEGGPWLPWVENPARKDPELANHGSYHTVHAIKFADGSIWDVANGWRAM